MVPLRTFTYQRACRLYLCYPPLHINEKRSLNENNLSSHYSKQDTQENWSNQIYTQIYTQILSIFFPNSVNQKRHFRRKWLGAGGGMIDFFPVSELRPPSGLLEKGNSHPKHSSFTWPFPPKTLLARQKILVKTIWLEEYGNQRRHTCYHDYIWSDMEREFWFSLQLFPPLTLSKRY